MSAKTLLNAAADKAAVAAAQAAAVASVDSNYSSLATVQNAFASADVDVQVFTANGTWIKPAGAETVRVTLISGGSGGGSGRRGAAGTVRSGGSGGGGGAINEATFIASELPSTVAVTVGSAGAGGAAITTDDTNGANAAGGSGKASLFGTYLQTGYGGAGQGGTATTATGGAGSSGAVLAAGGTGASSSGTGGAGGNALSAPSVSGGGSGGGITTANVASNGGNSNGYTNGAGGIVDTTAPTNGGAAATGTAHPGLSGGGGGASSITTAAQAGAAGALYGGGGGGGGASVNGFASGAGGAGAQGIVRVVTTIKNAPTLANAPQGILWSDEFLGTDLSWATDSGGGTWRTKGYEGGGSLSTGYADYAGSNWNLSPIQDPANSPFSVANSVLTITARRNPGLASAGAAAWVSGYLVTNHLTGLVWRYGYFEWRMRLPNPVRGMFPALWLFNNIAGRSDGKQGAELDMMEIFGDRLGNPIASGWHENPTPGTSANAATVNGIDVTQWHRYGIDWQPEHIVYYVDGVEIGRVPAPNVVWFQGADMGVRINYAMDPNWLTGSDPNHSQTTDPIVGTEPRMEVDWIRIYSKAPAILGAG